MKPAEDLKKEHEAIYPLADGSLSAAAQEELEKVFDKIEKEVIGPGRHDEFHRLFHRLKEEYLKEA